MKELATGVYVETAYQGANVGFISTEEGAVLVDAPMIPSEAWRWLRRVARISQSGLAFLINTDYHGDHVLGNSFFAASIIAHENTWRELKNHGDALLQRYIEEYKQKDPQIAADLTEAHIALPEITILDGITLHKGSRTIEVLFLGGHTPGSIGVYVPASRILFAGDVVVTGRHPNLAQAQSRQWLDALARIRSMSVDVIVPGHGEPTDVSAIEPLLLYIQEVRQRVQELYGGGASRREAVEKVRTAMIERYPVPVEEREIVATQIRASIERVYEEIRRGE